MTFTRNQILKAFNLNPEESTTNTSPFDDFWGVCVGVEPFEGEVDGDEGTFVSVGVEFKWQLDDGEIATVRYSLPKNRETGEFRKTEAGDPQHPHETSKWGTQIKMLPGIQGSDPLALVGLHAHVMKKEFKIPIRRKGKVVDEIDLTHRYIVDYDGYNNVIRADLGLPEGVMRKDKNAPPAKQEEVGTPAVSRNPEREALNTLVEESSDYYDFRRRLEAKATDWVELRQYLGRAVVEGWMEKGVVEMVNGKYQRGPYFDDVI